MRNDRTDIHICAVAAGIDLDGFRHIDPALKAVVMNIVPLDAVAGHAGAEVGEFKTVSPPCGELVMVNAIMACGTDHAHGVFTSPLAEKITRDTIVISCDRDLAVLKDESFQNDIIPVQIECAVLENGLLLILGAYGDRGRGGP